MRKVGLWAMTVGTVMLAATFAGFTAAPTLAQDGVDAMQAAGARLEAEQAQARANAARPGDELLTCEQIQAEMGANMNTQEMQTQTAEMGASAQRQQELQEEARQRQLGMMATGVVTGIVGSFVPGVGYAQSAVMQAQASEQQAAATESQREMAGLIGNMTNMMPAMMRGQRLNELAQAQDCSFARDLPKAER